MRAIVIDEFGGIEQLKERELPTPVPTDEEVLIKIAYAAVNPVDWRIRQGQYKERFSYGFPVILGWDAAGTIVKCGRNVQRWKKGDEVYAYCRKPQVQWGTYAEYVSIPQEFVATKPKKASFAEAAAIPLAGLTAWQSLFDSAHLKRGEGVLIHAGAGGVGGYAVQFAKWAGATVITTANRKNHGYVKELGTDHAIDYSKEDFVPAVLKVFPDGVDVVYDCVGGDVYAKSFPCLKTGGRIVSIRHPSDPELDKKYGVTSSYVFVHPDGTQLKEIAGLFDSGKIKAPALTEFSLSEVRKAHEASETRHIRGKIVLKVE
ncbi:MAG: NADP-dependent oxidoreductase [Pseudomonadota bacterium]